MAVGTPPHFGTVDDRPRIASSAGLPHTRDFPVIFLAVIDLLHIACCLHAPNYVSERVLRHRLSGGLQVGVVGVCAYGLWRQREARRAGGVVAT